MIHALSTVKACLVTSILTKLQEVSPGQACRNNKLAALVKAARLVEVVLFLAALGTFYCSVARAQIAPGPLSHAHEDLGGITRCTSCHDFGSRGLKCLQCHTEIRHRIEAGTGYHSRAPKAPGGELDCTRCHAEHRGPKTALIPLDRKSFDHGAQTGFALEGKHRELQCESCHTATKIAAADRLEIRVKDPNRSFLGLRRECTWCHREPHQNQLGTNCLGCHAPEAWKPASRFDHSRTAFPLTGLHQQVPCMKCHDRDEGRADSVQARNASAQVGSFQKVLLFRGLPHSGCQSCHADQHHGAFQDVKPGIRCEGCHNTGGFRNNHPARDFSHDLTGFRLVGKHADLPCTKCHKESNFRRPVPHEFCRDCHQDLHGGQFESRAEGSDCSACHSPASFKPTLFDREAHMRTAFPLVGKHLALPCQKCHPPGERATQFKTGKLRCQECHVEPHGGEFASAPYSNRCDLCHTPEGFKVTTFSRERHAQTRFPLTGRHTEIACTKCHKPLTSAISNAVMEISKVSLATSPFAQSAVPYALRQYHFASRSCNVCHADPHGFTPQANLDCETCHIPQQWNFLRPFDHSRTGFKLEGSHRDPANPISCIQCHKASGLSATDAGAAPIFSGTSAQCSGCHSARNPHGTQFSDPANRGKDCSSCHSPSSWSAASGGIYHDATGFALNGAHRKLACARCHKEQKEANGRMIRVYRDTPTDCLKCH